MDLSGSESFSVLGSKIELKSSENLYNFRNEIKLCKHENLFYVLHLTCWFCVEKIWRVELFQNLDIQFARVFSFINK